MYWINSTTFISWNFTNFFLPKNTMSACLNLGIESENNEHNFCAEKSMVESYFINIAGLFHVLSNFWPNEFQSKCMVSRVPGDIVSYKLLPKEEYEL